MPLIQQRELTSVVWITYTFLGEVPKVSWSPVWNGHHPDMAKQLRIWAQALQSQFLHCSVCPTCSKCTKHIPTVTKCGNLTKLPFSNVVLLTISWVGQWAWTVSVHVCPKQSLQANSQELSIRHLNVLSGSNPLSSPQSSICRTVNAVHAYFTWTSWGYEHLRLSSKRTCLREVCLSFINCIMNKGYRTATQMKIKWRKKKG